MDLMMHFKSCRKVFLAMAFSASAVVVHAAPHSASCVSQQPMYLQSMNLMANMLGSYYTSGSYELLDDTLNCLMVPEVRFESGRSGASGVYWFYRTQFPASGVAEGEAERIANWKSASRHSKFAEFADLRLLYSNAWGARGNEYANKTPEESMQEFKRRLDQTETAILNASPEVRDTPLAQNLLLAVVTDGGGTKAPVEVFQEGVTKWPTYYDFHEVLLSRLVPRWGGSWEMADQFVKYWAHQTKDTEGDAMYARLYSSLVKSNENPGETLIDWSRMKGSLDDLNRYYPSSTSANLAFSYACVYGDEAYLKKAVSLVQQYGADQSDWLRWTPMACVQYLQ
jgi:hypothetical protein